MTMSTRNIFKLQLKHVEIIRNVFKSNANAKNKIKYLSCCMWPHYFIINLTYLIRVCFALFGQYILGFGSAI